MPTVLLVRHGHSSANGEGILAGRLPGIHLTDRGREQADQLAARFRGLPAVRVVSSPLERCLETAALALQARRHLHEVDAALARVADGTYGRCAVCGEPIVPARLEARPTTDRCIRHA